MFVLFSPSACLFVLLLPFSHRGNLWHFPHWKRLIWRDVLVSSSSVCLFLLRFFLLLRLLFSLFLFCGYFSVSSCCYLCSASLFFLLLLFFPLLTSLDFRILLLVVFVWLVVSSFEVNLALVVSFPVVTFLLFLFLFLFRLFLVVSFLGLLFHFALFSI